MAEPDAAGTDAPPATLGGAKRAAHRPKGAGVLEGETTVWVRGGR